MTELRQTPPMRLFRPHPEPGEPSTVVVGNIAGGVAGGDRLGTRIATDGAPLLALTQAAEKVYRAHGGAARLRLDLAATAGGTLEWLSSGTILFDGAELDRRTTLSVGGGSRLLFAEILLFGRLARAERFTAGTLRDRIRLQRDGRLLWLDDLALGPRPLEQLAATAGFDGAVAAGTVLLAGAEASVLRDRLRQGVEPAEGVRFGTAALTERDLLVRVFGPDGLAVRRAVEATCRLLRSAALDRPARMPTIWSV